MRGITINQAKNTVRVSKQKNFDEHSSGVTMRVI